MRASLGERSGELDLDNRDVRANGTPLYLLRQGQQDRRQIQEAVQRAQASKVTMWTGWNPESPEADFDSPDVPAVYVANVSGQAVYEVFVDYDHPVDGRPVRIDVDRSRPARLAIVTW